MNQVDDRRRHVRKIGQGLVVLIDRRIFPIVNISTAGISFQATGYAVGETVSLKLAKMTDLKNAVDATISVKSAEEAITRGEFHPTMSLLRFIIDHIGDVTGVEPAYFRK
jgi:hypothetical protein